MTGAPVEGDMPLDEIPPVVDHKDAISDSEDVGTFENREARNGLEEAEGAFDNQKAQKGTPEESVPEKSVEGTDDRDVDTESREREGEGEEEEDVLQPKSSTTTNGMNDLPTATDDRRNDPPPIAVRKDDVHSEGVNSTSSPHLNSAAGDVAASPGPREFVSSVHSMLPSKVFLGEEPILTVENVAVAIELDEEMIPVGDEESLQGESKKNDFSVAAEVLRGANELEADAMTPAEPVTSSNIVDAANTQDLWKLDSKLDTKPVDNATGLKEVENEVSPAADVETNQQKNDPVDPPPSSLDDEIRPGDSRKNSIQNSNLKLEAEMQNGNEPGGLKLSSQTPPFSFEKPNCIESMNEYEHAATVHNPLTTDEVPVVAAQAGSMESSEDEHIRSGKVRGDNMSPVKHAEDSSMLSVTGAAALPISMKSVRADDALTQLQSTSMDGTHATLVTSQSPQAKVNSDLQDKTELEREMELFEEYERDRESRLLNSMRSDQSVQIDSADGVSKDVVNDKKRASESVLSETRKKRGKRGPHADEVLEEEDVCFICFDGGDLVLCDRRTCPKAYHLSCIGRDTAFFQKKGAWICGWHFCAMCTKPATFQCYTCPTAYCGNCLEKADFLCVRQRKGLCEDCWPIVKMIENQEVNADGVEVDFSDQETYEGLFKDYWEDLKLKLSLTPDELDKDGKADGGRAAFLELAGSVDKLDPENISIDSEEDIDEGEEEDEGEDDDEDPEAMDEDVKDVTKRKGKTKGESPEKNEAENEADIGSENDEDEDIAEDGEEDVNEAEVDEQHTVQPREYEGWASKELIEFVKYMDEDPKKPLTKFQVTTLLWSYIKSQKLQDPRKKTQILCDERLRSLFGKKSIGKFELVKHLPPHFAQKGGKRDKGQPPEEHPSLEENLTDADVSPAIEEKPSRFQKDVKDKRRRRKGEEEKIDRPNVNEFAAINPKNIGLIYLKRQLLEELLEDPELDSKVYNTFVRIRVPGLTSKSEMCYRLVQVVGTRLQADYYRAGRKLTNVVLEILNLQKREDVTVDVISNHEFTEEECSRLRQSIKCGLIRTLTVGDIEDKARALQEAKVNDWFETEKQRLVNLRDRASEKGRKRELRECVEKLQELNSPAFRAAKLQARLEVTADPRMDPEYESDGNDDKSGSTARKASILEKSSGNQLSLNIMKNSFNDNSKPEWDGSKSRLADTYARGREEDRQFDSVRSNEKSSFGRLGQSYASGNASDPAAFEDSDRSWRMEAQDGSSASSWTGNGRNRTAPAQKWNEQADLTVNVDTRSSRGGDFRGAAAGMVTPVFDPTTDWARREPVHPATPSVPLALQVPAQTVSSQAAVEAAEKEKAWHYMDPTGTVQGPFSMEQLRKWNTTGYFPEDLRIWKTNQPRDESVLLKDALVGRNAIDRPGVSFSARLQNPVAAIEEIAQALKSGDTWKDNGSASSGWTDRGGSGDVSRSTGWNPETSQGSRTFSRDHTGPGQFRETGDLKWKPGPASGNWDSYGRSVSSSPSIGTRADVTSWVSRSSSGRSERDNWGSSPAPGNEGGGGYSKATNTARSSWGRGSQQHRDPGSTWTPDEPGAHESSRSRSPRTRAARKDIPCRFYQKGYCKRGDSCDFWHG